MNRKQLINILSDASGFLSKHSTLPIIGMFCLGRTIKATDMEKYFEYDLDTGVDLCVPPIFLDILKNLDGEEVTLSQVNTTLHIACGSDKFTVDGDTSSKYVTIPEVVGNSTVINPTDLMRGFENVLPCIAEKCFSPIMTGIKISRKGGKLIFAGTDSFRLAEVNLNSNGEDFGIVLPKTHATTLIKVISKMNECTIKTSSNMVEFKGDGYTIRSLVIQGNFPEYNNPNIMPTEWNYIIKVEPIALAKAIKKITILTKEVNNYVEFDVVDGVMTLRSKNSDKGTSEVKIECKGNDIKFSLNGQYLLDMLSSFTGECEIKLVSSEKPITVKDFSRDCYTGIIRPLQ